MRRGTLAAVWLLAGLALAGCAVEPGVSTSTTFGPSSAKAIVLVGTSASSPQVLTWSGQSLSTFWQQYDPLAGRLIAEGPTLQTKVFKAPFTPFVGSGRGYLDPSIAVLEVEPGDYALIAAGFPHLMTLFVASLDGQTRAGTYVVDPRKYVEPAAKVDHRRNFLFSVAPGQVVYIGHLEFVKPALWDKFTSITYSLDPAAARAVLDDYPGITGEMVTLDLRLRTEEAAR